MECEMKIVAEESDQTKRAREKVRRLIDGQKKGITKEALLQKIADIQRHIAKNASSRVELPKERVSLFDQNVPFEQSADSVEKIVQKILAPIV